MTKIENNKLNNIIEKFGIDILVLLFLALIAGVGMLIIKNSSEKKPEIVFEKASEEVKGEVISKEDTRLNGPQFGQEEKSGAKTTEDKRVNLNTATRKELIALPEIGEKTADKIIGYREQIGLFKETSEITEIQGISEKTYLKIKDLIKVE